MSGVLNNNNLSTPNLDAILIGWSQQNAPRESIISLGNSYYSHEAEEAFNILTNTYGWEIRDGGLLP